MTCSGWGFEADGWVSSAACTPDRQLLNRAKASSGSHNLCINDRDICAEGAKEALTPLPPPDLPLPKWNAQFSQLLNYTILLLLSAKKLKKSTFTFQSEEAEVDVRERDTQRDREPKRARDLTLRDSCPDNSMQFGTRTTTAEPGFMGTWQNADTNLLFRMSQQVSYFQFFSLKKPRVICPSLPTTFLSKCFWN